MIWPAGIVRGKWSGREDSNLRPPGPEPGALPDCATPRLFLDLLRIDGARRACFYGKAAESVPPRACRTIWISLAEKVGGAACDRGVRSEPPRKNRPTTQGETAGPVKALRHSGQPCIESMAGLPECCGRSKAGPFRSAGLAPPGYMTGGAAGAGVVDGVRRRRLRAVERVLRPVRVAERGLRTPGFP